jgi:hypothetical protein
MSIQNVIARRNKAIADRPLLVVGMTQEEIDAMTFAFAGGSTFTDRQREAARIAGRELQWHPRYVLAVGAIDRPPLLWNGHKEKWEAHVKKWERQQTMAVEELAQEFVLEFNRVGRQCFERFIWSDELIGYEGEPPVRISADDCDRDRPCRVSHW